MKTLTILGAAALALATTAAHAATGGGGPVEPGDPCADGSCDPGQDPGTDPGTGDDGGSGGGATTTPGVSGVPTGVGTIFTLENLATGGYAPSTDYTALAPLPVTPSQQGDLNQTVDGLTLQLRTRDYVYDPANPTAAVPVIQVLDQSIFQYAPTYGDVGAYGSRSLSAIYQGEILATFSQDISDFSLLMYDFSNDPDTVTLNAYSGANGTGTLIGSLSFTGSDNAPIPTYSSSIVEFAGLSGVRSIGVTANTPGLFFDNFSAVAQSTAAVPEPASWAMMLAGFGLVGAGMRRRSTRMIQAI